MSISHHTSAMERTSESGWESEQTDCRRVLWTVDYHFGPSASQRQKVGRVRDGPWRKSGIFVHERSGRHLILGGDFNASFHGLTDFHHAGESTPRPRTLTDTNDTLRARALHAVVAELDLTATNTRMDASSEQELHTRSSWIHHCIEETGSKTHASDGLRLFQD